MTAAHIVIMILFAIAMIYYTIKWQKRRNDTSAPAQQTPGTRGPASEEREAALPSSGSAAHETGTHQLASHAPASQSAETAATDRKEHDSSLAEMIVEHYSSYFHTEAEHAVEEQTDACKMTVLQFPPTGKRAFWVSATCGLATVGGVELILYSADREAGLALQLADVATQAARRFAQTGSMLQPGLAFPLQSPIVPGSQLTHLYTSQALFEEESFSHFTDGARVVRFLMLHAISASEHEYLQTHGAEALEALFVKNQVNSIDFFRSSAIMTDSINGKKD